MPKNTLSIGVELTNFDELRQMLKALPASVESRVMGDAVKVALRPIQRTAKALAPVQTGALRRSISSLVRRYPKAGKIVGLVGPDNGYFSGGKRLKRGASRAGSSRPSRYAHLVEFGHFSGTRSGAFGGFKKGASIRKGTAAPASFIMARPFIRPAVQMGGPAAMAELRRGVEIGLTRETKRLAAKLKRIARRA